jgi:hypothetical protein
MFGLADERMTAFFQFLEPGGKDVMEQTSASGTLVTESAKAFAMRVQSSEPIGIIALKSAQFEIGAIGDGFREDNG